MGRDCCRLPSGGDEASHTCRGSGECKQGSDNVDERTKGERRREGGKEGRIVAVEEEDEKDDREREHVREREEAEGY